MMRLRGSVNNFGSLYVGYPLDEAKKSNLHSIITGDIKAVIKEDANLDFAIFTPKVAFSSSSNTAWGARTLMFTDNMALMSSSCAIFYYSTKISSMGVPLEIFLTALHEIPALVFVDSDHEGIPTYLNAVCSYNPMSEVYRVDGKGDDSFTKLRKQYIKAFLTKVINMKAMSAPRGVQ